MAEPPKKPADPAARMRAGLIVMFAGLVYFPMSAAAFLFAEEIWPGAPNWSTELVGWAMIALGLFLIGYGYFIRRRASAVLERGR